MKKIKKWFAENGFVGLGALVVAFVALLLGYGFVFTASLFFFLGKNWEIVKKLWKEEYKEKVEDVLDDIKDKIEK